MSINNKGNSKWVKGVSGNPKGRIPKEQTMCNILNSVLEEQSVSMNGSMITAKEAVSRKILALAMTGDLGALKYCFDRIDGPMVQRLSAEVDSSQTLKVDTRKLSDDQKSAIIAIAVESMGDSEEIHEDDNS